MKLRFSRHRHSFAAVADRANSRCAHDGTHSERGHPGITAIRRQGLLPCDTRATQAWNVKSEGGSPQGIACFACGAPPTTRSRQCDTLNIAARAGVRRLHFNSVSRIFCKRISAKAFAHLHTQLSSYTRRGSPTYNRASARDSPPLDPWSRVPS